VEGGVEPEPALGLAGREQVGLHHHVGDQEAVAEDLAFHVQAQHAADGASCAVGHDQPVGLQRERALGCFHLQHGAIGVRLDLRHLVLEAQLQVRQLQRALHQVLLQPVLLQVHHARALVVGLGQQVEAEDLGVAVEGAAHVPRHALGHHGVAHAEPVEHLERALGVAQAARADADGVVLVEQRHGTPSSASSMAAARPTGPAPTTTTRRGGLDAALAARRARRGRAGRRSAGRCRC
jgi:hypothetical protein